MKTSTKFLTAALITALLTLSGCASESSNNSGVELSSVDAMFLEMMIPHHNQAVEIAHLAEKNTKNPEILEIAKAIDEEQDKEVKLMSGWLGKTGGNEHAHEGHTMDGMLSPEQMESLEKAKDTEFDKLFLEGMILHHEGAIDMTQMVVESFNKEIRNLASSIISSQTAQIEQMKKLLASLN
jgi:uncharacterized protein (DUF305 family)